MIQFLQNIEFIDNVFIVIGPCGVLAKNFHGPFRVGGFVDATVDQTKAAFSEHVSQIVVLQEVLLLVDQKITGVKLHGLILHAVGPTAIDEFPSNGSHLKECVL